MAIVFKCAAGWFTQGICDYCGQAAYGNLGKSAHLKRHVNDGSMITSSRGHRRSERTTYAAITEARK